MEEAAIFAVEKGHNLFITGQEGVGKTFLLNRIASRLKRNGKKVFCTSSSGIASTNFSHVMTVHTDGLEFR